MKKSKITIDTSKNTIQEIPEEGRQQPVPSKQQSLSTPSHASINNTFDTSAFSGLIQERPSASNSSSSPTATSTNVNAKTKRVSRFAMERRQQR